MKKTAIGLAVITSTIGAGNVSAAYGDDHVSAVQNRVSYLEQRGQVQDELLRASQSYTNSWIQNLEIAGLVEAEAGTTSLDSSPDENGATIATVELALTAAINNWVEAEVALLYEDSGDTELDVDSATITIADPDSDWLVTTGRTAVPFGVFDTNIVSDPLTLEMGETFEDIFLFGIESNVISVGAYVFNGDIDEGRDEIKSFGAYLNLELESHNSAVAVSLGYLNNMGDTDGISAVNDDTGSIAEHVAGVSIALNYSSGPFNMIAEYVGAMDHFAANTLASNSVIASPSATNIEAAYNFRLSGNKTTVAISVQATDEAEDIGLSENKTLLAVSIGVIENSTVSFEFSSEEDYAGIKSDAFTAQLAVEF